MGTVDTDVLMKGKGTELREKIATFIGHGFLFVVTFAAATAILLILIFVFREALPFFRKFSLSTLFESQNWYPTDDPPSFGALGIFVGSAMVTAASCLIAVPMGIAAAVCLSDVVPFDVRQVVKPVIELLAAIPSVAYGFFALVIFAPLLQRQGGTLLAVGFWLLSAPIAFLAVVVISDVGSGLLSEKSRRIARAVIGVALGAVALWVLYVLGRKIMGLAIPSGVNALNASIILAIMALPTVVSVCEDALTAVPRELREGSYALGATRAETMLKVVIPAARGGILAAVLLGIMRAIGETMVVLMAAGNRIEVPQPLYNVLSGVRTLTATIALEMGETAHGGEHYHALFALGFCLVLFCFLLNVVSEWAVRHTKKKLEG